MSGARSFTCSAPIRSSSALRRFPLAKPFDLADAAYWAWDDLTRGAAAADVVAFYRKRAEERAGAEQQREEAGELRRSR